MGVVSPVGLDPATMWENLKAGVSGVDYISTFDASSYPTRIAGEVRDFKPTNYLEAREARRMSRTSQFAIASAGAALRSAALSLDSCDRERVGVLLGVGGIGSLPTVESEYRVLLQKGGMRMNPFFLPIMLPNMSAAQVARVYGNRGYNSTVVTACSAGTQAIGEGADVIRQGRADVMLAGGSDASICEFGLAAFNVIKALSTRNHNPKEASRPFDKDRDGFVCGEGAAVLVLESLEHALGRGAHILAEIAGFGSTADAYHMVAPEPRGDGMAGAMRAAMEDAGVQPEEIDYINAHGTSTPLNDRVETLAIKRVFGDHAYKVPISSTKSMIGHLIGGAGAVEAAVTIMTILEGTIHPTINYEHPDPECDLDYVPNVSRAATVDVALSNSFAFGGQNACLVLKRFQR